MKPYFTFIGIAFMLSACGDSIKDEATAKNLSKWPWFSVHSTISFQKSIERSDGSVALITYNNIQMQRDQDDVGVYLYPNYISCPLLGVTAPRSIKVGNETAKWGRTDFWDDAEAMYKWRMRDEWTQNDTPPFCEPPLPLLEKQKYNVECTGDEWENCPQKQRDYEVARGMYSAYAFCAEKNGKAVAICIQQMKDDEAMAKEIFESFRWID